MAFVAEQGVTEQVSHPLPISREQSLSRACEHTWSLRLRAGLVGSRLRLIQRQVARLTRNILERALWNTSCLETKGSKIGFVVEAGVSIVYLGLRLLQLRLAQLDDGAEAKVVASLC